VRRKQKKTQKNNKHREKGGEKTGPTGYGSWRPFRRQRGVVGGTKSQGKRGQKEKTFYLISSKGGPEKAKAAAERMGETKSP